MLVLVGETTVTVRERRAGVVNPSSPRRQGDGEFKMDDSPPAMPVLVLNFGCDSSEGDVRDANPNSQVERSFALCAIQT